VERPWSTGVEDGDVHPENEEIRGADMENHGADATCLRWVRSKGNSSGEAWAANDKLPSDRGDTGARRG
jgi:hypothetical protein